MCLLYIRSTALEVGEDYRAKEAKISLLIPKFRKIAKDDCYISWSLNGFSYDTVSKIHLLKGSFIEGKHSYSVVADKQKVRLCYYIFTR